MFKQYLFAATFWTTLSFASAHAEFSEEWQAVAEEIKAECAAFAATVSNDPAASELRLVERKGPAWPLGAAFRPHACVWLSFNIDAEGKPTDIEMVFRAPSSLNYAFVRETKKAIGGWRYELPVSHPNGLEGVHAGITFEPIEGKTYRFQYRISAPGL